MIYVFQKLNKMKPPIKKIASINAKNADFISLVIFFCKTHPVLQNSRKSHPKTNQYFCYSSKSAIKRIGDNTLIAHLFQSEVNSQNLEKLVSEAVSEEKRNKREIISCSYTEVHCSVNWTYFMY